MLDKQVIEVNRTKLSDTDSTLGKKWVTVYAG